MAATSHSLFSLFGLRRCFVAVTVIVFFLNCLPTATKAMPMKSVVEEAMMRARSQPRQGDEDHHREKRAVSKTTCAQPDNLENLFHQINSELGSTQFLKKLYNNKAISIPAGEVPQEVNGDPNESKTCPSSLTSDPSAPLAHRSLCPYYFNTLVLPEGYYPSSLKTAKCKCQQCVQNNAYGCEPVKTRVAVLKPVGCFQGLQQYEEQMFEVHTGCTCAVAGNAQTTTSAPASDTTSSWWVE